MKIKHTINILLLILLCTHNTYNLSFASNLDSTSFDPTQIKVTAKDTIPVGTIAIWSSSADVPDGWAECNGQTVNGIVTPNYQGYFLRGNGGESAELGVEQSYAVPDTSGGDDEGLMLQQRVWYCITSARGASVTVWSYVTDLLQCTYSYDSYGIPIFTNNNVGYEVIPDNKVGTVGENSWTPIIYQQDSGDTLGGGSYHNYNAVPNNPFSGLPTANELRPTNKSVRYIMKVE